MNYTLLMGLDARVKVAALCSYVASGERSLELTGPADGCVQLPGAGRARLDLADWPILFATQPLSTTPNTTTASTAPLCSACTSAGR